MLEHVAIELQNVAGTPVTFGKTRGTGEPGEYFVVYEYEQSEVGLEAGQLALQLLHSLLPPELRPDEFDAEHFDFQRRRDRFIRFAQSKALGPSTASLVAAAEKRGIPWLRLNGQSLIQLGHGRFQKRVQATDHQLDAAHRGRARLGQGGDRPAAGRSRPAGAQAAHGLRRRGRGRRRAGASASRSWSSRSTPITAAGSASG